jgi:hypothetical protein
MHGMQAEKLRYDEEQRQTERKAGTQKVLPVLQKAYPAQRDKIIACLI